MFAARPNSDKKVFKIQGHELQEKLRIIYAEGTKERDRMLVEWDASDAVYQGVSSGMGKTGYDAGVVGALIASVQQQSQEIALESTKLIKCNLFLHAKLCIADPVVTAKPFNSDYKNKQASQLAQVVIEHIRQNTNLQEELERGIYLNTATRGTGIMKVMWDPDKGKILKGPSLQNPKQETVCEGDYELKSISPKFLIIDPQATSIDRAVCAIEDIVMSLDDAKFAFDQQYHEKISDFMKSAENIQRLSDYGFKGLNAETVRTLVVCEYWEVGKPWNAMLGRRIRYIDTKTPFILADEDNPYAHKNLPYLLLTDIDVDNSKYGMSRNVYGIPLQEALNQFMTQVMANIELHGNIKLMEPEGSNNDDARTNDVSSVITFNPNTGSKPELLKPTTVTGDIWRLSDLIVKELESLFGMGEFSQGQIPRELSSYAVQLAIEADDKYRIRLFNKKKLFVKRLYEMLLDLTKQFVTETRMLKISGQENFTKSNYFKGADLVGDYGIYCDFGMYLPIDPGARKQQILELVKSGAFEKAGGNFKKLISILVDGDMLDIYDMFNQAKRRQDDEIARMIDGEQTPVEQWHEHESHIEALVEFMQTAFFETLPVGTKQTIFAHYKEHETELAKITAKAQPVQPGEGGPPPMPPG
jgi:hypothetical protein